MMKINETPLPISWRETLSGLSIPQSFLERATLRTFFDDALPASFSSFAVADGGEQILMGGITITNPTGGAITCNHIYTDGGAISRRMNASSSVAANGNTRFISAFVLEDGERIGATPASTGLNAFGFYYSFPTNLKAVLKTAKLTTFINGDNTLYTVPAGKKAFVLSVSNSTGPSFMDVKAIQYTNDSGGNSTIRYAYVPSGQVLDFSKHGMNGAGGVVATAGQLRVDNFPAIMNEGDKIMVNASSATDGQFAYMTVIELPA